jgi:triphosphoribosyl-dephospho-CoA synthase
MTQTAQLTIGQCATLACLLEVTAAKPGNVHRGADFADMGLTDFIASAVALGPVFEQAAAQSVGQTVLSAVRATQRVTTANTNLGIVLLLAPLAAVPRPVPLADGIAAVLQRLNGQDAADVYQAIALAQPGGLTPCDRRVPRHEVGTAPPADLREAMAVAAEWDLIARQYVNAYQQVLGCALPWLLQTAPERPWVERIVHVHIRMLSEYPDSLIARKCGQAVAAEAAARAQAVIEAGLPGSSAYWRAAADLDFWLRSDGNRRNPGTTADLIAAALFAGLREGTIRPPFA